MSEELTANSKSQFVEALDPLISAIDRAADLNRPGTFDRILGVMNIFTGIVAVVALALSIYTFRSTQESQAENQAILLLQDYYEKLFEYDKAERLHKNGKGPEPNIILLKSHEIFTAESIYDLVYENPAWATTVDLMILNAQQYLRSDDFVCEEHSPGFRALINRKLEESVCPVVSK